MARIKVRVTPRSSRSALSYVNGLLSARLHAPPNDGRANAELVDLFSRQLGIRKSDISVIHGFKSRDKEVAIEGLTQTDLDQIIRERLGQ